MTEPKLLSECELKNISALTLERDRYREALDGSKHADDCRASDANCAAPCEGCDAENCSYYPGKPLTCNCHKSVLEK